MVALGDRPERIGGRGEADDILAAAAGHVGAECDTSQQVQGQRRGQAERYGKLGIQPDALAIHAGAAGDSRDGAVKGRLFRVRADRQVALIAEGAHDLGGAPLACLAEQGLEAAGAGQYGSSLAAADQDGIYVFEPIYTVYRG